MRLALLMVHLLAAEAFAQNHARLRENPDYYFGAIAPDAIQMRDGFDKSHKNEVHLNNWVSPHPEEVLEYWRERHSDFDIGYGIHVLTDGFWVRRFHRMMPDILRPDGRPDPDFYYHETFLTDARLYEERDCARLIRLINRGQAPDDHPKLGKEHFEQWRDYLNESYRGLYNRTGTATRFTVEYIDGFLRDVTVPLNEIYGRYFHE